MTLTHSEQIGDLAQALLKAQAHFKPAKRSKVCDDGTRIADVSDIYEATRKPLAKQGLVVSQFVGHEAVETILMHAPTGQWLAARTSSARSQDGQVSYGPRTALLYALGVVEEPEAPKPLVPEQTWREVLGHQAWSEQTRDAIREAIEANRLSNGQALVILRQFPAIAENIISAAERLGGKR